MSRTIKNVKLKGPLSKPTKPKSTYTSGNSISKQRGKTPNAQQG